MGRQPDPIPSLLGRLRKIEDWMRRRESASPFFNTGWELVDQGQIAQGGSVTIPDNGLLLVDGGDVVMLNHDVVEVFRIGVMEHGDTGLALRRQDGTLALEMRKPFSPDNPSQVMILRDRVGRIIGGDALLSATGFDAPHMPMPFIPVDYTSNATAQSTSSTSFVATHEHRGFRQNPGLAPQFMIRCSDASTAAEVQVYDVLGGAYLGGYFGSPAVLTVTVPAGTTAFTLFELSGPAQVPGQMSDPIHLQFHARVTAGTGSVTVAPVRTLGGSA